MSIKRIGSDGAVQIAVVGASSAQDSTKPIGLLISALAECRLDALAADVQALEGLLNCDALSVQCTRHLYPLYRRCTQISRSLHCLSNIEGTKLQQIQDCWLSVLQKHHGKLVIRDVGGDVTLDLRTAQRLLKEGTAVLKSEFLSDRDVNVARKAAEIFSMEYSIFGFNGLPSEGRIFWMQHPNMVSLTINDLSGRIIGYAYGTALPVKRLGRYCFYLCGLGREPGASGMGIGQELIEKIGVEAQRRWPKLDCIALHCDVENTAALSMYKERFGFVATDSASKFYPRHDNFPADLSDATFLVRGLDGADAPDLMHKETQALWCLWLKHTANLHGPAYMAKQAQA